MKQWETFSVATCFIAYENTIKSTGPKWLCWGAWYPKSQSKVEEFKTKSQGNGELVVQHGELCFLFLEDPVKTCLVQKTAICFWSLKKNHPRTPCTLGFWTPPPEKLSESPQTSLRDLVRREFHSLCDSVKLTGGLHQLHH